MDNKGCGQLRSNDTYFDYICFRVVKTDKEAMSEEVDYCRPMKMRHEGFCLAAI